MPGEGDSEGDGDTESDGDSEGDGGDQSVPPSPVPTASLASTINLSPAEKSPAPAQPAQPAQTRPAHTRTSTIVEPTFLFSTTTERTTSIVTSLMTSFTLFESHYFNLTTDDADEGVSKEADVTTPDSVQYAVVTSDHQHSPRMYGEDMTEVIIIRKCSTPQFRSVKDLMILLRVVGRGGALSAAVLGLCELINPCPAPRPRRGV